MKKRILTGMFYVIVVAGLVVLKWLVPNGWGSYGFDLLFTLISILGAIELLNALEAAPSNDENKAVLYQHRVLSIAFCSIIIPLYAICETLMAGGWLAALIALAVYVLAVLGVYLLGLAKKDSNLASTKSLLNAFFVIGYCGVLSCLFSVINHIQLSTPAILMLFLTTSFTDCMAFFIGITLVRYIPHKLAPDISPKKTVVGSIGGLIGGVAGGVVTYFLYYGISAIGTKFVVDVPLLIKFILIGFLSSIAGQMGDLFESYIKRRCSVKDMGKILPGHGGILDRFDSMLFAGITTLLGFLMIIYL